jgi:hypothetical protein
MPWNDRPGMMQTIQAELLVMRPLIAVVSACSGAAFMGGKKKRRSSWPGYRNLTPPMATVRTSWRFFGHLSRRLVAVWKGLNKSQF